MESTGRGTYCNSFDLLSVISQFFFWEFKLLVGGEGT